jgi:hypothetical protein
MRWNEIKIGRSFKLHVYKEGISLWFKDRWIIDASEITKTRHVSISNNEEARLKIEVAGNSTPNTASPKLPLIVESNHICIYCVNGDKKEFMCSGCVPEYSLFKGRQLRAGA